MDDFFEDSGRPEDTSLRANTNVWYEKYRPKTVQDVILPEAMKAKIRGYLNDGGFKMPHLGLFSRTPGTGKSSLAKAILSDTGAEALWVNASLDKGIDILRGRIARFSAQRALRDSVKIVVMDEFDHFSKDGQAAFRGFIDQFGESVRFIFTGNYKENIIEPLLDRLEVYDFNQFGLQDIGKPIMLRLTQILEAENIEYDKKDVIEIIRQDFPKIRSMIGHLNQCIVDGRLVAQALTESSKLETLAAFVKSKNVNKVREVVYSLSGTDHLYGWMANHLPGMLDGPKHLNAIILLAKYQDMHVNARDKLLTAFACCCELMKL